jgi:hypothetical protein
VPCSASRVVPGAHRVVGPGTHQGSGPRKVHTTAPTTMQRGCVGAPVPQRGWGTTLSEASGGPVGAAGRSSAVEGRASVEEGQRGATEHHEVGPTARAKL